MDPELRDLLRKVSVDCDDIQSTHGTFYGPKNKWAIPSQNHEDFWKGYCDLISKKSQDPLSKICLGEKPIDVIPVMANFLFKFHADKQTDDDEERWEPYDDTFLLWICYIYQSVIAEYFRISNKNRIELTVIVLESASHWFEEKKGSRYMVMEVKLQFPYAKLDANMQNKIIRNRVIELLHKYNIMGNMQRQPLGSWDQIISVINLDVPIIMYGSSEEENKPKLAISHIWSEISKEIFECEEECTYDDLNIEDVFFFTNHIHVQQDSVNEMMFTGKLSNHNYWLPMFLSIGYWTKNLLLKETTQKKKPTALQSSSQQNVFGSKKSSSLEDDDDNLMELAEKMLQMLSKTRFYNEPMWLDIGKALYNSSKGDDNGLLCWIRYTNKSLEGKEPFDFMKYSWNLEESCREKYHTFANNPITIKTIAWYAKEDSPDQYKQWHKDWCFPAMENALSGLNTDVAIALYKVYWLDFSYFPSGSSGRSGSWFQFKNHRWYEAKQGIELRRAISGDFMRKFEKTRIILCRQSHESNDDTFRSNTEITVKKITRLMANLKTVSFKNSLVTEATEKFRNYDLVYLLDANPDILGVTNGVLEVVNNNIIFRNSKPEDYVSMCTNIPYQSSFTYDHPLVQECMTWFKQTFPDPELLRHFLKFAASCLKGVNNDKVFAIWTGSGNNSKSMIVKLFEATFNSYCIKFPVSLLSEKQGNSAGPTPQLARAKSTRVAFLDEPETNISLHPGTVKRYTGGDSYFARLLNENGGDVKSTFKMVLQCNNPPLFKDPDGAVKDRTRFFTFISKWVKNPKEKNEFQMDPRFDRRIPCLATAFLWIMVQYFPIYSEEGLIDPPCVKEITESYWRDSDVYAHFIADNIQEVIDDYGKPDPNVRLTLNEIFQAFKVWHTDSFPNVRPPNRTVVKTELTNKFGRMVSNGWIGIMLLTDNTSSNMSETLGGRNKKSILEDEKKKIQYNDQSLAFASKDAVQI
jgi:phage/plasmid-associated DNA primase